MKLLAEFLGGLLVGITLSFATFILFVGFIEPDPLQEQASRKAYCKTVEEYLSLPQEPQEKLAFIQKHEKSLTRCDLR